MGPPIQVWKQEGEELDAPFRVPQLHQDITDCPVSSYNEWDPLEEAIVGRLDGSIIPEHHPVTTFNVPRSAARLLHIFGGRRYPQFMIRRTQQQLDEFIHILEAEGVTVRRPDATSFTKRYKTPHWRSKGHSMACPRDGFMVIGEEIIETPMAWRCRYFEPYAYKSLFKEYFAKGAKWTAAPRPQLLDDLYDQAYSVPAKGEPLRFVTTEFEPVFDAADFVRCGRDLFVTRSNVTNRSGIEWLRRHLGDQYEIHEIETLCRQPMHIDSSFMPLAPGKVLINPEYVDPAKLPRMFKSWDILTAPQPDPIAGRIPSVCSEWISINVLMLDEKRVICEKGQPSMIKALKNWGFEPIPCSFIHYAHFGGSVHCATLDIRRRGQLKSYF